jgi:carbon monoxide dehydrogenase subunit G
MIELTGEVEFGASRDLLWEMILDPEVLASILPGCSRLVIVNENEYQGNMKIKIGPVDGEFRGTVALSDLRPHEGFHLVVNGRGPSGIVEGEGDVRLADSENGTQFTYGGTGQISGRMATVGQRVMNSSAKAVVKQSLENLDKQVQARTGPRLAAESPTTKAEPIPAGAAPPPPGQTEFFLGVAANMFEDLVPDPQRRKLLVGLALVAIISVLANWYAGIVARRAVKMMKEERG